MLDCPPDDWDITTSKGPPKQVKRTALSYRGYRAGARYRNRPHLREGFEVTTYRIDGKYEDGRHPRM